MTTIRVSVTDVEQWLYCMDHDEMTVEELLRRLRREEPETEAMRAGTAFHKALELVAEGQLLALNADGYWFDIVTEAQIELSPFRELKMEREYQIDGLIIQLVGKVDAMQGNRIEDHKTTSRFDADRAEQFANGYQWRLYLDLAEANEFRWNVFVTKQTGEREYDVTDFHRLSQFRYPGLHDDCVAKLKEFVEFLELDRMNAPAQTCTLAEILRANRFTEAA